jgi:hypothetical protein
VATLRERLAIQQAPKPGVTAVAEAVTDVPAGSGGAAPDKPEEAPTAAAQTAAESKPDGDPMAPPEVAANQPGPPGTSASVSTNRTAQKATAPAAK